MVGGQSFWSPRVRDLVPYVPGEQPKISNLVKLNTNENPYPPSPRVLAAIAQAQHDLRLYPDPESTALRQAIADHHGLTAGQVFPGNGSDEVLAHAFFAFFQQGPGRPLLMPDVTYSFYRVYCQLYGIEVNLLPLDAALQVDVADYAGQAAGGVVIANPNAPTGSALPLASVEKLLNSQPDCMVLVDEAYVDFGAESAMGLIDRYPNLLVVHTLSKSRSLAGLRVGFAAGQRHLVEALERVKDSFNSYPLDRLAVAGAVASYQDNQYFNETRLAVMQTRDELTLGLWRLGFEVVPSSANFVFVRHPAHDAGTLAAQLRQHGILVRHFKQPRVDQYLRITIGTASQCNSLVDALRLLLAQNRGGCDNSANSSL